jgi:hypothetical protein
MNILYFDRLIFGPFALSSEILLVVAGFIVLCPDSARWKGGAKTEKLSCRSELHFSAGFPIFFDSSANNEFRCSI